MFPEVVLPASLMGAFLVSLLVGLLAGRPLSRMATTNRRRETMPRSEHLRRSRLGGVGVFAALLGGLLAGVATSVLIDAGPLRIPELTLSIVFASSILFVIGLLDDVRGVTPLVKLAAQSAASLMVYYSGFRIGAVSLVPGHELALGVASLPVTVLWLVGVSNAFNLIDGLDGLAAGIGIIALTAITASALILSNTAVALYSVALTGALLGFLRYNFPPARIILGDSGSLVVGFLLAILAVRGGSTMGGVSYILVPIFSLAYPLLDTGVAILRRWLRGVPLSRADVSHIHHRLRDLGLTPQRSVAVICVGSAVLSALGLSAAFGKPLLTLAATLAGVILLLSVLGYGIGKLGYHEFREAGTSVVSAARKGRLVIQDKINARDVASSIRHASSIEALESILRDACETFRFAHLQLGQHSQPQSIPDLIIPDFPSQELWRLDYPVTVGTRADSEGWFLTVWGWTRVTARPAGAERVAQILAPAIGAWISSRNLIPVSRSRECPPVSGAFIVTSPKGTANA